MTVMTKMMINKFFGLTRRAVWIRIWPRFVFSNRLQMFSIIFTIVSVENILSYHSGININININIIILIKRNLEMKVRTRRNDVGRVEVQLAAALTSAPKRDRDEQDWAMNISISCQLLRS